MALVHKERGETPQKWSDFLHLALFVFHYTFFSLIVPDKRANFDLMFILYMKNGLGGDDDDADR